MKYKSPIANGIIRFIKMIGVDTNRENMTPVKPPNTASRIDVGYKSDNEKMSPDKISVIVMYSGKILCFKSDISNEKQRVANEQ